MTPKELQVYLHEKIPVAAFMQVAVSGLREDQVELSAPLAPSLNVHGTLFGGSAASLALLAAWALAHLRTQSLGLHAPLVVRSHEMRYLRPVTGRVEVYASFATDAAWPAFVEQLQAQGRGRISLKATVSSQAVLCAELAAEFAVRREA
jgi:thioesterase domain-containing protein